MTSQRIILGDCLDVFANERNVPAFVSDPPANIGFMGRNWDKAHGDADGFSLMLPARSKAHERELCDEYRFAKYWAIRYAMAYDIADQHAVNIVWTLPRTSHQTANALRGAGWTIKDNLVHLFGSGWAKTGNALAPGQEGWLLATKGKPDLDIDACRVPRGGEKLQIGSATMGYGGTTVPKERSDSSPLGSLPKNALLSHCEECVRVGTKLVKATPPKDNRGKPHGANKIDPRASLRNDIWAGFGSTESAPAFHCLAGCACGARAVWDPDKPLSRCPCGGTWRWLCPVAEVNGQSGESVATVGKKNNRHGSGCSAGLRPQEHETGFADQGGAARYFNTFQYLSKCSPSERHAGCENLFWRADKKNPFGFDRVTMEEWEALPDMQAASFQNTPSVCNNGGGKPGQRARGNVHPTAKSYRLMHWLHSLTGASRILDMTAGSGTGMYTAFLDGTDWLGAEVCPEAIVIAEARLAFWRGLSFEARRAFLEDDIVPAKQESIAAQRSLFDELT